MKSYFFLSILCFLIESPAFSQASSTAYTPASKTIDPQAGPIVTFPREVASQLYGGGRRGVMNCSILLNKQWAYPNGQVVAFCNEAETSCIRYGLLRQKMKGAQSGDEIHKIFALARQDVELKLHGCVLAIESTINTGNSVGESSGFSY